MGRNRLVLGGLAAAVVMFVLALPAGASAACTGVPKKSCLLPFPNDLTQTKKDRTTPTGRRVNFSRSAMPKNASGVAINPTEWNRSDGFSPGQPIMVHVPSLKTQSNFDRSRIVPVNDLAQYTKKTQPLLLLDEKTGKRQIVWGELDANNPPVATRNLVIHPAKNLVPGRRYVVVLRNLRDRAPRGESKTWSKALRKALAKAKVKTSKVYLAWDFTVASDRSLTARQLAIRNDAFKQLGDTNLADGQIQGRAPTFTVTSVQDFTPDQNAKIARTVTGTFIVPCYLNQSGCPAGSRFHYSSTKKDALPTQMPGNVDVAPFQCNIPRAASTAPSHIALYGHGLLGDHTQIDEGNIQDMSSEHDFTFCATDWQGMASDDVPFIRDSIFKDFSNFPGLADRLQQGVLNTLYLGRLLAHPQGLASNAAFQGPGGQKLLDTSNLYFDSNSQGAILGGNTTALAPDWTRAVLGVATMNYSLLLPRSTDFDTYAFFFAQGYPDEGQRLEIISLAQMLWDRGETDGWAQHATTKPPKGTPKHTILMHVAVGDHQVANAASDIEARTIGASAYRPAVAAGRSLDKTPLFGIPSIRSFPFRGSAIVYWDGGPQTPPAPKVNLPNREGKDPHSFPRSTRAARQQKSDFLLNGVVNNVCGSAICKTDNYG